MERDVSYLKAKKKVENLKAFYIHLVIYVLVNILLFVVNLVTYDGYWWFIYPLGGWGMGLIAHSLSTFEFADGIFGRDWEERKIKKYMEKDKDH